MSKEAMGERSQSRSAVQMLRQVSRRVSNLADSFRRLNAEPVKDVERGEGKREVPGVETADEGARRGRNKERRLLHMKHDREPSHTQEDLHTASEKVPLAAGLAETEQNGLSTGGALLEDNVERSTGSDSRRADTAEIPGAAAGAAVAHETTSPLANAKIVTPMRTASAELGSVRQGTEALLGFGRTRETEGAYSTWASVAEKPPLLRRFRNWVVNRLMDLFGSEMDFDTAYARAKKEHTPGELGIPSTAHTDSDRDSVHAAEHIYFFPLRFRDASLEKEYGEVCGQLFIGRDIMVLVLTLILIIPVTWWLASICFRSVELDAHSHGAWVAFQSACAVDSGVAIVALTWMAFPMFSRWLHAHYELFSYVITLLWMSVLLVVLAMFPRLVRAPAQMDILFNFSAEQIVEEVKQMSPLCRLLNSLPALEDLVSRLTADPPQTEEGVKACVANPQCTLAAIETAAQSVAICARELAAAQGTLGPSHTLADVWLPFAFYVGYVKQTLQVFKMPLLAIAVIIVHFGTGMMFMDSLSPSRTRFTIFLHVIVVPICAMPFILLRFTYPSIIPPEESALFVFTFFVVAMAGYLGRYAQEFQHRLLFCSWRLTSKRLGEMHEKMKEQKKQKKSSTAIEDLISQVKECQSICTLATSRGRRADVTAELMQIEKILENILELLTQTENLYSVRFTDDAAQNEVQRQFIELYNKPDKRLRKLGAPSSLRRAGFTGKRTASIAKDEQLMAAIPSEKTFGSGASPAFTFEQMQHTHSTTSPVLGFEFGSNFHQMTSVVDSLGGTFQPLPMPEFTNMLLSTVGIDWDFDMLHLSTKTENILVEVGYALLCRLVTDWNCDESCLLRFLVAIQAQYLNNPYHNAIHGAEVAHLTECLTRMLNAQRGMNSVDKVTLTVAAICHDVGHPGRNNQFFVNSYDPLAVIYNDVAVLENFHSCLTFRTLESRECNLFTNLDDSEFRFVRQNLIECILATDMKQHFESISRFRIRRLSPEFNYMKNVEDRWLLARMCMKVADIGHSSVPWTQHFDWSCRVVEEFYLQGDEELARGLPLSPLCDREKHSDMGKSQAGFLEFVVKPLLKEIEEVDPFNRIETEVVTTIESNRKKWLMLQEEGTEIVLPSHVAADLPESTMTAYAVRRIAGLRSSKRAAAAAQTHGAHIAAVAAAQYGAANGKPREGDLELSHAARMSGATPSAVHAELEVIEEGESAGKFEGVDRRGSGGVTTTEGTEDRRRSSDYSGTAEVLEVPSDQRRHSRRPSGEPEPDSSAGTARGTREEAEGKRKESGPVKPEDSDVSPGLDLFWEGGSSGSQESNTFEPTDGSMNEA